MPCLSNIPFPVLVPRITTSYHSVWKKVLSSTCCSLNNYKQIRKVQKNDFTDTMQVCLLIRRWFCLYVDWFDSDVNETMVSSTRSTPDVSCSPRWIVYPNMHSYKAWWYTAAETQQQCLDACVANSSCVAVDWNDYSECWIHDKRRRRFRWPGITQLEIVRQCNQKSSMWPSLFVF